MDLILNKVGKAYKTIRQNGFLSGSRIVGAYFLGFLRNIFQKKEGDILIITGGVGDSAFYRATNQCEELNLHNLKCASAVAEDPFLNRYVQKFKLFIFHRTLYTPKIAKLIGEIKKQKSEIIFDTDDLVFDAELFHETDSYKNMNALEKKQYEKGVGEEIISDPYVKVCTTSTSYLADRLREKGKQVFVSKNKISSHELEIAGNILKNIPKIKDNFIRVGYFSGTYSHNRDFATITDALMEVLEKYPQVKLYLAGYLEEDHILSKYKDRIAKLPFVSRDRYYENIWKVDINLAPLVKGDPFCESKSELKFFEAGILKIPTIAVRNQTFSQAIADGIDGFLADNNSEWVEKIGKLIEDENLRREMGEKAREKVLCNYTNKNSHNEEYYKYLKNRIEN